MNNVTNFAMSNKQLVQSFIATITDKQQDHFIIDHCQSAKQAFGCVVELEINDCVYVIEKDGRCYIIQLLQRASQNTIKLMSKDADTICLESNHLVLNSLSTTRLQSIGNIDIVSCNGKISHQASQIVSCAIENLVQMARTIIQRSTTVDIEAESLFKSHSLHQLITASSDIKIDAERINMG